MVVIVSASFSLRLPVLSVSQSFRCLTLSLCAALLSVTLTLSSPGQNWDHLTGARHLRRVPCPSAVCEARRGEIEPCLARVEWETEEEVGRLGWILKLVPSTIKSRIPPRSIRTTEADG